MKRIVVIGSGPLPSQPSSRHSASGFRAWQFIKALAAEGHRVHLLLFTDDPPPRDLPASCSVACLPSTAPEARSATALRNAIGRADALVGASTFPSYLAARSSHPAPLWIDVHGDPIAEAQSRFALEPRAKDTFDAHWLLGWCLRRGDRFSAVSGAQRFALLGQLGSAGRLSAQTIVTDLVAVIPDSLDWSPPISAIADDGEFPIHFSGSFNSWIDGPTLGEAMALTLREEAAVRYVFTGGPIFGYLENPWHSFVASLERLLTSDRDRVSVLGWVDDAELDRVESRVCCGVIAERTCIERELGSQNRGLRWMARALPAVMTGLSELGRTVEREQLGLCYEPHNARSLADCLLRLAHDRSLARRLGRNARQWLSDHRSTEATTAPLVRWASSPALAPDRTDQVLAATVRRLSQIPLDQLHLEENRLDDPSEN